MPAVELEDVEDFENAPIEELFETSRGKGSTPTGGINVIEKRAWDRPWGEVRKPAQERHGDRSRQARTADESFNAPLPETYAQWAANPNRYDYPMVDTIPPERVLARAEAFAGEALEAGAVSSIKDDKEYVAGRMGIFDAKGQKVRMDPDLEVDRDTAVSDTYGFTLAHELGHAVDHAASDAQVRGQPNPTGFRFFSEIDAHRTDWLSAEDFARQQEREEGGGDGFGMDRDLINELYGLSSRARGGIEGDYRGSMTEITADAVALNRLEPRAVRRDYPKAAEWLEDLERRALPEEA